MRKLFTRARLKWLAFAAACWALTPLAFAAADLERGYDSTGGEAILPLLPVLIAVMVMAHRKTIN